jgi:hypothetical protein
MAISSWSAGIIRPVAVAPTGPYQDGVASGVWTMDEAAYWTKQGLWPIAGNALIRGIFAGGVNNYQSLQTVTIPTLGNAVSFGSLSVGIRGASGFASSTRGIFGGAANSSGEPINVIQYITIASAATSIDFGDTTVSRSATGGASNETRGLFAGGDSGPALNVIDYITIATTGNATDFGDLTQSRFALAGLASTTRAVFGGGLLSATVRTTIDYVTIASTGDAVSFGDLSNRTQHLAACSSATRGLFAGGQNNTSQEVNIIEYITISSTGAATDFGDLLYATYTIAGTSSSTRGIFGGGISDSSGIGAMNVISYVTIATTGNALDFGDLVSTQYLLSACSNAHGGL